ncbi:TetR/AcrR family transcriptional regulator [Gordonia neofelifaecis]|uniref:TetR family transcriptional regulator n=1 Tax=Gordonia neofelifaecis NRRL B-59395 TaxID=644548 RepID=F1YHZ8_9ACTN|nr:TetR/AcrR family transcriptional regulator [Gordonia neofelifaecis]EGD55552.1 TetR family transcriptional regulator [Gordonia neofelifaecis NRRL B-59395]
MARTYDNTARSEAASATRRRILAGARRLIVDGGYATFSIAALAESAQVSPQTVYNSIGGKSAVLKAVYDVAVVGDDEPIPMSRRPEFLRLGAAESVDEWADAYAHHTARLYERVGEIVGAVLGPGAPQDRGAGEFAATIERERRVGSTHAVTALADRMGWPSADLPQIVDAVWTLNSPDVFSRLVRQSGWSPAEYERWLAGQLRATLHGSGR